MIVVITNYDWDKIGIFFNSYVKANFENTDLVVYADNIKEVTLNKIKQCATFVLPIPDEYKKRQILNIRWKLSSIYLKENIDKYNLVFTADVRDLFFQKDVFKYYQNIKKSFLGLALEDGFIGQESVNTGWIKAAYKNDIYDSIASERIICMGTVWGTVDKFVEFVDIMWEKLNTEWANKTGVIDQAVGNVIIHHDKLFSDSIIHSNNIDGPVMSIALTNRVFINLDKNKNVLNVKGDIAAVVHQYDRKADIVQIAKDKYYPEFNVIKKEEDKKQKKENTLKISVLIASILCFLILSTLYYYQHKNKNNEIISVVKNNEEEEGK